MPQAKNPWMIGASIIIIAFVGGVQLSRAHGETSILDACKDAAWPAVMAACYWIGTASPLALMVRETKSNYAETSAKILPDGSRQETQTTVEQSIKTSEPPCPPPV